MQLKYSPLCGFKASVSKRPVLHCSCSSGASSNTLATSVCSRSKKDPCSPFANFSAIECREFVPARVLTNSSTETSCRVSAPLSFSATSENDRSMVFGSRCQLSSVTGRPCAGPRHASTRKHTTAASNAPLQCNLAPKPAISGHAALSLESHAVSSLLFEEVQRPSSSPIAVGSSICGDDSQRFQFPFRPHPPESNKKSPSMLQIGQTKSLLYLISVESPISPPKLNRGSFSINIIAEVPRR
eukprot:2111394-Rhodomonas_salina.1